MERVVLIEHRGKTVLVEDFSEMHPGPDLVAAIEAAHQVITAQPPRSVLALVDVRGTRYDAGIVGALKDVTVRNAPFQLALVAVSRASGRSFRPFPDRAAALDWLVEQ